MRDKRAAIVTGASSGIGFAVAKLLLEKEYKVYGIGRSFDDVEEEYTGFGENFVKIELDLSDTAVLTDTVRNIKKKENVSILVNNAGVGYYGLHEELKIFNIQEMVRVNLEVPMILTNILLRDLKKNRGYIFNIESVTARQDNPHGCAYGATKAGLLSFARSIFEENRKYGIRVINILPDMTRTNLYRNADFREGEETGSFLCPQDVSAAVEYALSQREGVVVTELSLRPQLHRIRKQGGTKIAETKG